MLKDYFTYDEYKWAVSSVMTRQNSVPSENAEISEIGEEEHVNTLIPFWDMCNHCVDVPEIGTDYDKDAQTIRCMANKEFVAGDHFTIFYGKRSNLDLLVHNGFVLENNPFNTLVIKLGISKNDQLVKSKNDLLAKLVISPQGHFTLKPRPDNVASLDPAVFAFLRVMNMSSAKQIEEWSEKAKDLLAAETSDHELDKKALNYLQTRCALLMKSYPNTLEEDVALLAGGGQQEREEKQMTPVRRMCVLLRRQEKEILNDTIRMCQEKLGSMM
jgi:histone-lysine N-methyltransferase SETD3